MVGRTQVLAFSDETLYLEVDHQSQQPGDIQENRVIRDKILP
jgi:hypothetical protein